MKKPWIVLLLFIVTAAFAYSQDGGDVSSDSAAKNDPAGKDATDDTDVSLKDFVDILNFGIEEEVVGLLKDLPRNLNDNFYRLLQERFEGAELVNTKVELAKFFWTCDTIPPGLLEALYETALDEDSEKTLKTATFPALAKHGASREHLFLLSQLDSEDSIILQKASNVIGRVEDKSIAGPLVERLKLSDTSDDRYLSDEIKGNLILALGEIGDPGSAPYLREVIADSANDKFVIMYGMHSLAKLKDLSSIDAIRENLKDEDVKIQEYAAYALSSFESPEVSPILRKMLLHNNARVRIYACQGIMLNGDTEAVSVLQYKFGKDPDNNVRYEAIKTLITLGDPGLKAARELERQKKFSMFALAAVAEAVKEKPDLMNVSYLIELYRGTDKKGKETIARVIVRSKSNMVDPIIKVLLQSEDYLIRIGALKAVQSIENSTLWPEVKSIADSDPVKTVRKSAKKYLELKQVQ